MRLELSRRTDLALRSLRVLEADGGRIKRTDLARAVGTSADFLARVMAPLVGAGWALSEVGRSGGYELAADLAELSVLDVVTVVEGTPEDGRCVLRGGPCEAPAPCALHEAWTRGGGP